MKIKLTRSFQKTKQIQQYEPIVAMCEVSVEMEGESSTGIDKAAEQLSRALDDFVKAEVKKTIDDEVNEKAKKIEAKAKGDTIDDFGEH